MVRLIVEQQKSLEVLSNVLAACEGKYREEGQGAHNTKEVKEIPKNVRIQTPLKSCLAEVGRFY